MPTNSKRMLNIVACLAALSACFLLGRLLKSDISPGIRVEYPKLPELPAEGGTGPASANMTLSSHKGNYFASKKGKKYYPLGCSTGKSIKIENRTYFQTIEEAERAGYEKTAGCRY